MALSPITLNAAGTIGGFAGTSAVPNYQIANQSLGGLNFSPPDILSQYLKLTGGNYPTFPQTTQIVPKTTQQTPVATSPLPTPKIASGGITTLATPISQQTSLPLTQEKGLGGLLGQIQTLTPEQKQLLGLAESPEQKAQREGLQASLTRLIDLQTQLAKVGAPSEALQNLDRIIGEQTRTLQNVNPTDVLRNNPTFRDVGITQGQLERVTASQRQPIERGLSDLLFSRSVLAGQQQAQVESLKGQIGGIEQETSLREAIGKLQQPNVLSGAVSGELLKNFLSPPTTNDIKEYDLAKQQGFKGTFLDYQKQTANLKQPTNIFGAFSGGAETIDSIAQGLINGSVAPSQLPGFGANSLRAQALARVFQLNPKFDLQGAENTFKSKQTYAGYINSATYQNVIKYLDSVTPNLAEVVKLSDSIPRTFFKPLNKAYITTLANTGDENAARLVTATTEVADQLAKILQGGGTGSGTSDAKLKQAIDILNTNYSVKQFRGVAKELQVLLGNRATALKKDTLQTIQKQQGITADTGLSDKEAYQLYLKAVGK